MITDLVERLAATWSNEMQTPAPWVLIVVGLAVCLVLLERWLLRLEVRDRAQAREDALWHAEALFHADSEGRILEAEPEFRNRRARLEWRRQHWPLP